MTSRAPPERVPDDWPNRGHSRSLACGGIDWHVQVAGEGPVVLLLHGTGSASHTWADVLPRLADAAKVVAPDLPGHGFTTGASVTGLRPLAAALAALLDTLRVAPRVAVGHSAGAALALQWVLARRAAVTPILGFNPSLVPPPGLYTHLVAPVVTPIATAAPTASALAALASRARLVASLLQSTRSAIPDAQRARYEALFRDPAHVRGTLRFMAATDLDALLRDSAGHAGPMTLVAGRRDAWVGEGALRRVAARYFPQARIESWDGGHLLHEEYPDRAAALVRTMLEVSG